MSDRYMIRNCPCYWHIGEDDGCSLENMKLCEDDTDCVMKQIVELAKGHTELCKNCEQQIKEYDCGDICNAYRLDKILKLLDIQEVE